MIAIVDFEENELLCHKEVLDKVRSIADNWPVTGFIFVGAPVLSSMNSMMLSSLRFFSIDPLLSVYFEPQYGLWPVTIKIPSYNVGFG